MWKCHESCSEGIFSPIRNERRPQLLWESVLLRMATQFCGPKRSEQSQIRSGCTALPLAAVCAERDARLLVSVSKTCVMFNLRDSPELRVEEFIYQGYLVKSSCKQSLTPGSWLGLLQWLSHGEGLCGLVVLWAERAQRCLGWLQMCKVHIWALCEEPWRKSSDRRLQLLPGGACKRSPRSFSRWWAVLNPQLGKAVSDAPSCRSCCRGMGRPWVLITRADAVGYPQRRQWRGATGINNSVF